MVKFMSISNEVKDLLKEQEDKLISICEDCLRFSEYTHTEDELNDDNRVHGHIVREAYELASITERFRKSSYQDYEQGRREWNKYKKVTEKSFALADYLYSEATNVSPFRKTALTKHANYLHDLAQQQALLNINFGWGLLSRVLSE